MKGVDIRTGLSPSHVRLLTAIAWLQLKRKSLTWRNLMRTLGVRSTNGIKNAIEGLRRVGLIESAKSANGGDGYSAAAITVRCRFIHADQLGKEQPCQS